MTVMCEQCGFKNCEIMQELQKCIAQSEQQLKEEKYIPGIEYDNALSK
jgi:uncharacterized ferredoxin-like protein